jgi:hypothetical protein
MKYFLTGVLLFLSQVISLAENYNVFEENGKYGLKNQEGVVLIPAHYEALGWSEGSFSVIDQVTGFKQNNLWGLISILNKPLTPAEYFTISPGSGSWLIATKRSPLTLRIAAGCVDTSGKIIIPFTYSGIKLHSLLAIVYTLDGNVLKYGLIDMNNRVILPQRYQNIYQVGSLRLAVQNFNNKTALFTEAGKPVTDFVIDSISQVQKGYAVIYQNGKQGLMDREGRIVRQSIYREIVLQDERYRLRKSGEWHILDASNQLLQKIEADSIATIGFNRMKIVSSTGTQLVDLDFRPVSREEIHQLGSFQWNGLATFTRNNKVGVIKADGSVLLQPQFQLIQIDKDALIGYSVSAGKRSCYLFDHTGKQKSTKKYDQILPFNGSVFPVVKNGFQGGLGKDGNELIACAYDSLLDTYANLVVVKFKGQYGIINLKEEWIVIPQPNRISLLSHERYFEHAGDLTYLKSIDGTTIYFTSNRFEVKDNSLIEAVSGGGKWTINMNGQIVHREQPANEFVETIFPSSEGLRGIRRNGRYGFIDDQGRLRVANRYEDIMPFQEGLAGIKIRNKWGFINKEDKIIVQPSFESVTPFENGRSKVKQNGKYGLISKDGKTLIDFRYDGLHILPSDRVLVVSGQSAGLADTDGNLLLQPRYESIQDLNNGYAIIENNGKFGVVNVQGVSTIPALYDQLFFEPTHNIFLGLLHSPYQELTDTK